MQNKNKWKRNIEGSELMNNPINILVIEDNIGDARLVKEEFKDSSILVNIHHVEDGVEGLLFLRKAGKYLRAAHPKIILLDLNMPKKSGHEVLAEIKSDKELKKISVIMLTTSNNEEDIKKSFELQADGYMIKPFNLEEYLKITESIPAFA